MSRHRLDSNRQGRRSRDATSRIDGCAGFDRGDASVRRNGAGASGNLHRDNQPTRPNHSPGRVHDPARAQRWSKRGRLLSHSTSIALGKGRSSARSPVGRRSSTRRPRVELRPARRSGAPTVRQARSSTTSPALGMRSSSRPASPSTALAVWSRRRRSSQRDRSRGRRGRRNLAAPGAETTYRHRAELTSAVRRVNAVVLIATGALLVMSSTAASALPKITQPAQSRPCPSANGPAACKRPFSRSSPFNTRVPADPKLVSNSAQIVHRIVRQGPPAAISRRIRRHPE